MKSVPSDQIAKIGTADIGTMDALPRNWSISMAIAPWGVTYFPHYDRSCRADTYENEGYADLFNDYMCERMPNFSKIGPQLRRKWQDYKAFRDLVYDVHNFSQATAGPENGVKIF